MALVASLGVNDPGQARCPMSLLPPLVGAGLNANIAMMKRQIQLSELLV